MSIQVLQSHYGFARMPFGRDLAPGMLHRSAGHGEAVARIAWCIAERALGVVTGEVGSGKTVAARAATAALDASRHTTIYLGNPAIGARGSTPRSSVPSAGCPGSIRHLSSPRPPMPWPPRRPNGASGSSSWSMRGTSSMPNSSRSCAC